MDTRMVKEKFNISSPEGLVLYTGTVLDYPEFDYTVFHISEVDSYFGPENEPQTESDFMSLIITKSNTVNITSSAVVLRDGYMDKIATVIEFCKQYTERIKR